MTAFPAISRAANFRSFKDGLADDPTIRSEFENGAVLTRSRYTATKQKFEVVYNHLTAADKTLLETLQTTVNVGADVFDWTNPTDSVSYSVRLAGAMQFRTEPRHPDKWEARMTLIEA